MSAPDPQYTINPGFIQDQIFTGLRDLGIVVGGATAFLGFVKTHALAEDIEWLKSSAAAPAIGAFTALAIFGYRQFKAYRDKKRLVTVAHAAPDSVAVVTQPTPPPAAA